MIPSLHPTRAERTWQGARRLSVVSATSCARRRLIRDVGPVKLPDPFERGPASGQLQLGTPGDAGEQGNEPEGAARVAEAGGAAAHG